MWEPGCYVDAVIPTKKDGQIDQEGLRKNLYFWLLQGKVQGVLIKSSRGREFEKEKLAIEECSGYAGRETSVVAGVSFLSSRDASEKAQRLQKAGCDGVALYERLSLKRVIYRNTYRYYEEIARSAPLLKVIICNSERENGSPLSPGELKALEWRIPNICGVISKAREAIEIEKLCRPDFTVFLGNDRDVFQISGPQKKKGVFSLLGNIFPGVMQNAISQATEKDTSETVKIRETLEPLLKILQPGSARRDIQIIMSVLGMPAPSTFVEKSEIWKIREALLKIMKREEAGWLFEPVENFYKVDVEKKIRDDNAWKEFVGKNTKTAL